MIGTSRLSTATAMAMRDQLRRPLVLVLIVVLPAYVVTRSIAQTIATPRRIGLPDGIFVTTTMKAVHGAGMGGVVVAFVAAILGVFVMQSALDADRRLVVAGYRPGETVLARFTVLVAGIALVVGVSAIATAASFDAEQWIPLLGALLLLGLIYASLGALAGALLDKLAATYLMLFLVMTDLGVVQQPMFYVTPGRFAPLLPGYGPSRVMYDAAFSAEFHAGAELLLALAWAGATSLAVTVALRRAVGTRG